MHRAIVGGFGFAGVERAENGLSHDGLLTKCLGQSLRHCGTRSKQTQSQGRLVKRTVLVALVLQLHDDGVEFAKLFLERVYLLDKIFDVVLHCS